MTAVDIASPISKPAQSVNQVERRQQRFVLLTLMLIAAGWQRRRIIHGGESRLRWATDGRDCGRRTGHRGGTGNNAHTK